MKFTDLTASLIIKKRGGGDPQVQALAYDSRNVRPGSLFVAIPGAVVDGHSFLDQAVRLGAEAAVVEKYRTELRIAQIEVDDTRRALAILANKFFDRPSRKLKLIGVTGTNGKTTTAFILESIFHQAGLATGLIGSIEYRINRERFEAKHTTPESLDLQQILAKMVTEGVDVAVVEVSSHALDLHRVDGCRFAARIFTNLSQDHLDYHADMEAYFAAKARLFVDPAFDPALTIINSDDEFGRRLREMTEGRTFGREGADYRISNVRWDSSGTSYLLEGLGQTLAITCPLLGDFNVSNSAAAAVTALELGVEAETVIAGIAKTPVVPGRFELVDCAQDFRVLVDYAHTPDGLKKVLAAAKKLAGAKRVITVFGCGGDRDRGKRPQMGKIAANFSDLAIVTSDNPRSEGPQSIIEDILGGIDQGDLGKTKVLVEREAAIRAAVSEAEPGDVVVIAGKGHEDYQLIEDKVLPFDDRRVAEKALRERCV